MNVEEIMKALKHGAYLQASSGAVYYLYRNFDDTAPKVVPGALVTLLIMEDKLNSDRSNRWFLVK